MIPERLVPGTQEWDQYHYEHEQRYEFFAPRFRGLDVLDVACGIGYGSAILADGGGKTVTGVDVAAEAVDYARQHYVRPGVDFVNCRAEDLHELGRVFDGAVSFETIEHVPDPRRFIEAVHGVLRPGGLFVCSTPNRDFRGKNGTANPYHLSEMSFAEFAKVFADFFRIDEQYYQSHSDAYLRHLSLVREVDRIARVNRFSKFLAAENWLRGLLKKDRWDLKPMASALAQAVPGDFIIAPLTAPRDSQLTFILVGRSRQ